MVGLDPLRMAIRQASDPLVIMRRVVEQATTLVPASDGAVLELLQGDRLTYACATGSLEPHVGTSLPVDGSLSGLAVRTRETLHSDDCANDPRANSTAYEREGAVSLICVPLVRAGEAVGALKVTSSQRSAFSSEDVATLSNLAEFIGVAIGAISELSRAATALLGDPERDAEPPYASGEQPAAAGLGAFVANVLAPGVVDELDLRRRLEGTITRARFRMLLQPIVDLTTGRLIGAEALARFPGRPQQSPDRWFADANRIGLGVALELAAITKALEALPALPADAFLAVNLGPEALAADELPELIERHDPTRLVIELTEHLHIEDYPNLRSTLAIVRELGVRLAIDDTGAGFASLAHILELAPDLIKLDRRFSHAIDTDPARRAVAQSLVSLSREIGATTIAEGVETPAELHTIRRLDIPYGQGYLISRPRPARSLPHHLPHLASDVTVRRS